MAENYNYRRYVGQYVGLDLVDGRGVSGVICGVSGNKLLVLQYLYARQFATFQYPFEEIRAIRRFPSCRGNRES